VGSVIAACFKESPLGIFTTFTLGKRQYSANPPFCENPGSE